MLRDKMKISFNTAYNPNSVRPQYDKKNNPFAMKYGFMQSDTFYLSKNSFSEPAFGGVFDFFKDSKVDVNIDPNTLSRQEMFRMEQKTTDEINEILLSPSASDKAIERMHQLVNSPFFNFTRQPLKKKYKDIYEIISKEFFIEDYNRNLIHKLILDCVKSEKLAPNIGISLLGQHYCRHLEESPVAKETFEALNDVLEKHGLSNASRHTLLMCAIRAHAKKLFNTYAPEDCSSLDNALLSAIFYSEHRNWLQNLYKAEDVRNLILDEKAPFKDKQKYQFLFSYPENCTPEVLIEVAKSGQNYSEENRLKKNEIFGDNVLVALHDNLTDSAHGKKFVDNLMQYVKRNADSNASASFDPYLYTLSMLEVIPYSSLKITSDEFKQLSVKNGFKHGFCNQYKDSFYADLENLRNEDFNLEEFEIYSVDDFDTAMKSLESIGTSPKSNVWAQLVVNNLPDIFLTDENKKQYQKIVDKLNLKYGDWSYKDKQGNNLAHRAVVAENPLLIKLAADKGVSFSVPNSNGDTALNLIEKYGNNPDVKAALKNIHIYDSKFFFLVNNNIASGVRLLLKKTEIDLNRREPQNGRTPLLVAANSGSVDVMKVLLKQPDIDINATDYNGNNAGILAAQHGHTDIIKLLNELEDFDINYINPETNESIYTACKNSETLLTVLKNKKANPNLSKEGKKPLLFEMLDRATKLKQDKDEFKLLMENFYLLATDKRTNLKQKYNGQLLGRYMADKGFNKQDIERLSNFVNQRYVDKFRKLVEKDGVLSMNKIKEYVLFPSANQSILNEPLNDLGEPIGFFLADLECNEDNILDFIEVVNSLKSKKYDFTSKNKFGQTLLDKALDAENLFLIEYLQKQTGVDG